MSSQDAVKQWCQYLKFEFHYEGKQYTTYTSNVNFTNIQFNIIAMSYNVHILMCIKMKSDTFWFKLHICIVKTFVK